MVQTALNDEDVFGAVSEGKVAAVGDHAFRGASVLCDQPGREVHAFEVGKTEALEGDQTVSAAAEKLDDLGVARPLRFAQSGEARDKFSNFLLRRFETQIR